MTVTFLATREKKLIELVPLGEWTFIIVVKHAIYMQLLTK
jgi:hypothetical protein